MNLVFQFLKKKWKYAGITIICVLIGIPLTFYRPSYNDVLKIMGFLEESSFKDVALNLWHARVSFQKSLNIVHFPYWFYKSKLPVFQITINPKDLAIMDRSLPKNLFSDNLEAENKIFVPALFESEDYKEKVNVRYRGAVNDHWIHAQRSLLVQFPQKKLFQTMGGIDLIIPNDRAYLAEIVNNLRLTRAGLLTPHMFFAWVKIDQQSAGVYLVKERFSAGWIEKEGRQPESEIFSQSASPSPDTPAFNSGIDFYNLWERDIDKKNTAFSELETLFKILKNPDDAFFRKHIGNILDVDLWYKAIAINILAGDSHSLKTSLNLFFNSATGKFEPLLEDIHAYDSHYKNTETPYDDSDPITRRLLSSQNFYKEYLQTLAGIASAENLKEDLALYDSLYARLKPEFYKDQTKYRNDFEVDRRIKEIRTWMQENYGVAQNLLNVKNPPAGETAEAQDEEELKNFSFPPPFEHLSDISLSPSEFVKTHPQFRLLGRNLTLPSGEYVFRKNIIIPQGSELTVQAGTKIYLGPKISFVSYSPIQALGTPQNPILFARLEPGKNWGSIAIINTKERSDISNVVTIGGSSSDRINGVVFTGSLSAHNTEIHIVDSQFYDDSDDDIVNIKYGVDGSIVNSSFARGAGDAIDLDAPNHFLIEGNTFSQIGLDKTIGGDGVDISMTRDTTISENKITDAGDKCISVGENSIVDIRDNTMSHCTIGVAIKDLSKALIQNNTIEDTEEGIGLYQKKPIFGGGEATLEGNIFIRVNVEINKSENSTVIIPEK
ncbi:MAG: CotH kinase family protein [Candidatus Spechtbacteria bacterium]|nr:CotH kinase family protein [Candidatus Spechtbacteria bacterium]